MAQVPPNPAAPNVEQSGAATPGLDLHPPAEAFGANVAGMGLEDFSKSLGVTADQMSQAALQLQAVNNKTAADTAGTSTIQQQAEVEAHYRSNNMGLAAQANLPTLYKQLDDIRQQGATGLSPLAAADYQSYTRSMQSRLIGQTVAWSADQGKQASLGASNGKIATYQAMGAANPNDPDTLQTAVRGIALEVGYQSQQLGLTPEAGTALLHDKVGAIYQSGIHQAIDAGDILGAQAMFALRKSDMTKDQIDSVAGALKVGANSFVLKGFAEDIAAGVIPQDRRAAVAGASNAPLAANNNPTNLQPLGEGRMWPGQTGVNGRFATFATPQAGIDAAVSNLHSYYTQHNIDTLAGITARWAPAGDGRNDPTAYANTLGHTLGIDPHAKLDMNDTGLLQRIVAAQTPIEMGHGGGAATAPPPGPRFTEPPPVIRPNEDPDSIRAAYADYNHRAATAMFGDNPALAAQAEQSANSLVDIHIRGVAAAQTAQFNQLDQWVTSGLPNGKAVASISDLPASAVAALSPALQVRLGEDINRSVAGYGAFKTPAMETNADNLMALKYSNPALFADSSRTNIAAMDLSAADRLKFIGLQGAEGKDLQLQRDHQEKLQTILADPVVAAQVKTIAPDAASRNSTNPDYMQYLGALMGQVERAEAANGGKALPPKEVEAIAQKLALSHTTPGSGWHIGPLSFGQSSTPNYQVAPTDEADIRRQVNAVNPGAGDALTANQIAEIYSRARGQ